MRKWGDIFGEWALWAGAIVVILALHYGVGIWAERWAAANPPAGLPKAIYIQMAPPESFASPEPVPAEQPQAEPEPAPKAEPEAEAEPVDEPIEVPEPKQLEPIEDFSSLIPQVDTPSALALTSSVAPDRRPERRKKQTRPDPEPRQERRSEAEPRRQTQQSSQRSAPSRSAPQGIPGPSAQQVQRMTVTWRDLVGPCIARQVKRVKARSGEGLTISVSITIARSGRVQGVRLGGSTGNARTDQAISRAAGRARCPAAPRGFPRANQTFTLPILID